MTVGSSRRRWTPRIRKWRSAANTPYIWATWLPRLLTGENSCEWAVWFKAHYQDWTRTPSEFNQAEWMLNRTSLLNEQKTQWEARGQDVYVESQNSFRLRGQSATLAGRPDLIVVRNDDALVIDIKAGQQQRSHYVQIMIYMYALPRALPQYQHAKLAGEIVYPTLTVRVPRGSLHTQFIKDLGALIRRLAADKPPECRADRNVASATSAPWTARSVWTKAPSPKAELPATSDFPHLASLPVQGTGETTAAVCPECRRASGRRQTQTVRPCRSNREICCCPHLDRRSSADSLFFGVHVTTF